MKSIFVTDIIVENVRHLKNITIPLSQDKFKHLIFTGKMEVAKRVFCRQFLVISMRLQRLMNYQMVKRF